MLGQLATLIYNLADMYFVSLTREAPQIAAVTLCTPVLLIIMSIATIFGMGGSSVCARLLGEERKKEAANCFHFCSYAIAICSVVVMILGLLFIRQIAEIIGAYDMNMEFTCDYLRWIFIGAPAIMLANGFVHCFRSVGLIREATIGLLIGNGINILFDWIFIVPMKLGTKGAAMATALGFVCATVYYILCVFAQERKSSEVVRISPQRFSYDKKIVFDVIAIGIPGAMITVLMSVSNIVLNNFISRYGSDAVAAYGIAYKVDMFPIMLSVGLAQGTAPLLGYYFGRREHRKLSKTMQIATGYELLLGGVFTLLLFLGSSVIVRIFLKERELIELTAFFLKLLCFHAPVLGIINMVTSYFQALGKARNSLWITILRNILLFIPRVVLMNYVWGLQGVMLTQLFVEIVLAGICLVMYLYNQPHKLIYFLSKKAKAF